MEYRDRARLSLDTAYAGGLRDPETMLGLAEIYSQTDPTRSLELANEVLADPHAPPTFRALALTIVSYDNAQRSNNEGAIKLLEELVKMRRFAEDWRLLGSIHLRQNAPEKALAALQKALEIRPFRPSIHAALAETYIKLGKPQLAEEHREKARQLFKYKQD
jgi:tetratricopeptide (TPR) repeat protein